MVIKSSEKEGMHVSEGEYRSPEVSAMVDQWIRLGPGNRPMRTELDCAKQN